MVALAGVPAAYRSAAARAPPYRVSLIGGAVEGQGFVTGLLVDLDDGWKTYWRMPGDAGIPPAFDWSKSVNLKSAEVRYPVPTRFHDDAGETIGFKHRVVFPVIVTAADAAQPVKLELALFLGTCRDICIPAQVRASLELGFRSPNPAEQMLVSEWLERVPRREEGVRRAYIEGGTLRLELAEAVEDIFVESGTAAYFRAPQFSADGRQAGLLVDGLKNLSTLKGAPLTVTLRRGLGGIEQTVTVE